MHSIFISIWLYLRKSNTFPFNNVTLSVTFIHIHNDSETHIRSTYARRYHLRAASQFVYNLQMCSFENKNVWKLTCYVLKVLF